MKNGWKFNNRLGVMGPTREGGGVRDLLGGENGGGWD